MAGAPMLSYTRLLRGPYVHWTRMSYISHSPLWQSCYCTLHPLAPTRLSFLNTKCSLITMDMTGFSGCARLFIVFGVLQLSLVQCAYELSAVIVTIMIHSWWYIWFLSWLRRFAFSYDYTILYPQAMNAVFFGSISPVASVIVSIAVHHL